MNWDLNKVCLCQKYLVNVVNWWSYVILTVAVQFFWDTLYTYLFYSIARYSVSQKIHDK